MGKKIPRTGKLNDELQHAEEQAHQAVEIFEKTFHGNPAAMTLTRMADGRVIEVNDSWLELTGLRREEVIGKTSLGLGLWTNPEERDEIVREVQQYGVVRGREVHIHGHDRDRTVLFYAQTLSLRGEQALISSAMDITERKGSEQRLAANLDALTRMHALSTRVLDAAGTQPLMQEVMDAAVAIVGADKGTLQLLEGDKLHIVAHHGHEQPFLAFFAAAEEVASACGASMKEGRRVVVEDIEKSDLFVGTPSLSVLRNAGVRAVQSTPLVSRNGKLLGILTTHWARVYSPDEHDLWRIDLLARQAADLIGYKQSAESLRERERLLQTVMDGSTSPIFLKDLDGRFLTINAALERMLGISREEIKGKTDYDIASMEVADYWRTHDKQVMATRKAIQIEEAADLQDGHHIFLANKFPLVDVAGQIYGIGSISHDITERKRAEEQLARNEKTFSELVERAPFGIYIVDSQFRIAHMNTGSQTGAFRNVRPVIGRYFGEAMRILWPEPVAAEIVGHFRHTLETGEPYYSPRFTNPRHDVEIIESYEWELHRMTLPDGQYGVICYYFDSTALRNAQLALQEANATLERRVEERTQELSQRAAQLRALTGELTLAEQRERSRLAIVLHDHLQQLLVAAKFRLTILGRGGDDIVKAAAKEVEELIDDSVAASRSLTAELSPPILQEGGLNAGLQWLARRMADTQGLFVDLELNESGPLPEDVKILMFQSVRELLFNVVKHANTHSAIVNLRRFDNSLQVTVSDQGAGFDAAVMSAVGEGSRGFGLFGIRERLEFMGGTLGIESSPGQGSRFVLSVPITRITATEKEPAKKPVLPKTHLAPSVYPDPELKIRVLLADDHAVVRQGIANLLADESDIEVVGQASDGQEAIDMAVRLLPDVILMDVSMPKLNGVEATRVIRNGLPTIRIIGLSMFEDIERAQAMRDAGAVDYLTKSGQADALINAIRKSVQAPSKVLSAQSAN